LLPHPLYRFILVINSTTSPTKSRNGFGTSFFELNRSRMKILTNDISEEIEHNNNNKCSKKKEMASSEGNYKKNLKLIETHTFNSRDKNSSI
jgi:hypothetical protein